MDTNMLLLLGLAAVFILSAVGVWLGNRGK